MELPEVVKLIVDNGLAIGIVIYFLWRDSKYQATMLQTLTTLKDSVALLLEYVKGMKQS